MYVVSTMNLLHFRSGRSLTSALAQKYGVSHYDVYADQHTRDLYFIEPRTDDGSSVGAFAYEMGWLMPMSVCFVTRQTSRAARSERCLCVVPQ